MIGHPQENGRHEIEHPVDMFAKAPNPTSHPKYIFGVGLRHCRDLRFGIYLGRSFPELGAAAVSKTISSSATGKPGPVGSNTSIPLRLHVTEGAPLGRMEIPRLGVSVILVEGVKPRDLRLAVGHIPGTAFPDELGNVGLAGHRDTFFRELKGIRRGDLIVVTTIRESTQYSVEWTHIVKPRNVEVLEASPEPVLTLVTCYPFYFVGPAPERFVVRASRIRPLTTAHVSYNQ